MKCYFNKTTILSFTIFAILSFSPSGLSADEIYLTNGDRITGEIIMETTDLLKIQNEIMGSVEVKKKFIDHIGSKTPAEIVKPKETPTPKPKLWKSKFEAGFSQAEGNTQSKSGSVALSTSRKTDHDEWTIGAQGHYSSSNGEMDEKKYAGIIRYAFNFGEEKRWYNFYKFEGTKDRFANINYRLVPAFGVGYWIADEEDYKAMVEAAVGLEHTNYRDNTDTTSEPVLIPRAYFEKKLIQDLKLSQEIILYPELSHFKNYRMYLKTDLTNPISEKLSWKISFVDEYNSNPSGSTEKNDYRLTSSLVYSF